MQVCYNKRQTPTRTWSWKQYLTNIRIITCLQLQLQLGTQFPLHKCTLLPIRKTIKTVMR
jgi:hypothetical protein